MDEPFAWAYRGFFNGHKLPWQLTTEKWLAERERERGDEVIPLFTGDMMQAFGDSRYDQGYHDAIEMFDED